MNEALDDEVEQFWDAHYEGRRGTWDGKPNALLVGELSDVTPGTALDLGCGQGGDAIWLASHGWTVTAVDVSATALALAAGHAAAAGVSDGIEWQRHDLSDYFPTGAFDLVSACYLHSPVELPRGSILRAAARAVAPGGTLVVVGHAGSPSWADHDHEVSLPTPDEVLDDLALEPGRWEVRRSALVTRQRLDPDGRPGSTPDNVLHLGRLG